MEHGVKLAIVLLMIVTGTMLIMALLVAYSYMSIGTWLMLVLGVLIVAIIFSTVVFRD